MLVALPPEAEMYAALARRDTAYEGVFFVGVKTTGIFCRPGCPARTPKPGNVEYFENTRSALLAGYRPCKRCRPMEPAQAAPTWMRTLVEDVEADPGQRWKDADLRQRGLDPATVRRWFQRVHGMTFHAFERARRLGAALGRLHQGESPLQAGLGAGYDSASGFADAFAKMFGRTPGHATDAQVVAVTRVSTVLGPMVAAASDDALYLLEFADRRMLQTQIDRLRNRLPAQFVPGDNDVLAQTQRELSEYFDGSRTNFDIPLETPGTDFQRDVWNALRTIPYGRTRSYAQQAEAIGRPAAVRAVGRANGDNRIAILIPCHRVVGKDGQLVGYGGQVWRKKALLALETPERVAADPCSGHEATPSSRRLRR